MEYQKFKVWGEWNATGKFSDEQIFSYFFIVSIVILIIILSFCNFKITFYNQKMSFELRGNCKTKISNKQTKIMSE
jgi:hypothetical protein